LSQVLFESLIDYLEERLNDEESDKIQKLLQESSDARKQLEAARLFLQSARSQELAEPPRTLVDRALSAFRRRAHQLNDRIQQMPTLQFDSALSPAPSGVRGSTEERQLLYSVGSFDLDMQMQRHVASGTITLRGQLLTPDMPADGLVGIPISLMSDIGEERHSLTDKLGRFSISHLSIGNYAMRLTFDQYDILVDPLVVDE
jgi:hypothetical protein